MANTLGCFFISIKKMNIADVLEMHLQYILNFLSGKSKSLVNKVRIILKSMFRKAKKNKLISEDPAEDLTIPSCRSGHFRSLTEDERNWFLSVASGENTIRNCDRARIQAAGIFYKTMYYCGIRGGEAAALQVKDIDRQYGGLWIVKAIKATDKVGDPKTEKSRRFVPIPDNFYHALIEYTDGLGLEADDYIFTQPKTGRPHTKTSRNKMWWAFKREMCVVAGNPIGKYGKLIPLNAPVCVGATPIYTVASDLTPHCLRHTFCTDALLAGVPIQAVSELMGHEDVKTTEIYNSHPFVALLYAKDTLNKYHQQKEDALKHRLVFPHS
jgi:integrase